MHRTERQHGTSCRDDALGGLLPQLLNFAPFSLRLSIIVFKILLPLTAFATSGGTIPHSHPAGATHLGDFFGVSV